MAKIKNFISILMGKLKKSCDKGLQCSKLCLPRPCTDKVSLLALQESLED